MYDVIIIGAGPAGIACAVQLNRSGIKPLVIEKKRVGGMLYNANLVENFPGFPVGISGRRLAMLMKKQFELNGIICKANTVLSLKFNNNAFTAETEKKVYRSKFIVIASGTKPKKLNRIEISPPAEKRIYYEIYKIINSKAKKIVIVGAGDLAFDYAINLGKKNNITMLNRSAKISCLPVLKKRAGSLKNINYHANTILKRVSFENNKMLIWAVKKRNLIKFDADYLVAAIGRLPNFEFFPEYYSGRQSLMNYNKNFFIIGDAANRIYRQTSIAVGDGIKAAMMISERIRGENESN